MKKFVLLLMVILVAMMSFANDTISIVDFHSKDANSSDWYILKGVISGIDNAGYNGQASFYLTDETGTVWGDGLSRTKESVPGLMVSELTAMGVDNGDVLTIGARCAVNDNASIAGARRLSWAYYISHKDAEGGNNGENGGDVTPNDSIVTPPEPEPEPKPEPENEIDFPAEPSELELTRAEYWYDFTGTGEKGMVRSGYYYSEVNVERDQDYDLYLDNITQNNLTSLTTSRRQFDKSKVFASTDYLPASVSFHTSLKTYEN